MTTMTLLDASLRPSILGPDPAAAGATDGGLTLDDVLVGAWEGLTATHTAPCLVCAGRLVPRYGAGPGPVGGRCADCGSELS